MQSQGLLFPEEGEHENISSRLLHFEDCATAILSEISMYAIFDAANRVESRTAPK